MNKEQERQLEQALQDDEFAFQWAEADRDTCKIIRRIIYSRFHWFWNLYYGVMMR